MGQTVLELDLRKKRGLNIIAIKHEGKTLIDIDPGYTFANGDIIVLIGHSKSIEQYEEFLLK